MKKIILLAILLISVLSCAQNKESILGETEHQREMNAKFKDASKSPLTDKDRKTFKALEFFKFDAAYVVTANFKRTPNEKTFKMKTTTDRQPIYTKYGELSFKIKGEDCKLDVFQNVESLKQAGEEESLFLPFLDYTNGEETYGGGRYVNIEMPKGNTLVIDFNKAYNPYCAYNDNYSCPVVPRVNSLAVSVEAGVKAFKKH